VEDVGGSAIILYAKSLLPAKPRWTDTLEGASDASHPQLRSYAMLARARHLASPLVIVAFVSPSCVCSTCRRRRRRRRRRYSSYSSSSSSCRTEKRGYSAARPPPLMLPLAVTPGADQTDILLISDNDTGLLLPVAPPLPSPGVAIGDLT